MSSGAIENKAPGSVLRARGRSALEEPGERGEERLLLLCSQSADGLQMMPRADKRLAGEPET